MDEEKNFLNTAFFRKFQFCSEKKIVKIKGVLPFVNKISRIFHLVRIFNFVVKKYRQNEK